MRRRRHFRRLRDARKPYAEIAREHNRQKERCTKDDFARRLSAENVTDTGRYPTAIVVPLGGCADRSITVRS